jgi:hypothetical protein
MSKYKAGLHKEISLIFNGIPIPNGRLGQQLPEQPNPDPVRSDHPNHLGPSQQSLQSPAAHPAVQSTGSAQSQPPEQPLLKAAVPKKPEANIITKTAFRLRWQQSWEQIKQKLFAPKPGASAKRQITTAVMIPILFIVLIFVLKQVLVTSAPRATLSKTIEPEGNATTTTNKIDWQIPPLYPEALRDPMQPAWVTTSQMQSGNQELIVKGILYSEDKPTAIIGTNIVEVGDKILGATVVGINSDHVEFEMNGKRWEQKVR